MGESEQRKQSRLRYQRRNRDKQKAYRDRPEIKARFRDYLRERSALIRTWLVEQKDKPCADCGRTFPPIVMEFDHVRGKKTAHISNMTNYSIASLKKEIAKCDLVCANCHRIRTWLRQEG